jgi:hypothetical protein
MYDAYMRFKRALEAGQEIVILYLGDYDPSGIDMIRDIRDRPLEMLCSMNQLFADEFDEWVKENWEGDIHMAYDDLDEYRDLEEFPHAFDRIEGEERDYEFNPMRAWLHRVFTVVPVSLTKQQIDRYKPPPNPAKKTDPRSKDFIRKHGSSSWEVDALRPEVLNALLTSDIESRIDLDLYNYILEEEVIDKAKLVTLKQMSEDVEPDKDYLLENS